MTDKSDKFVHVTDLNRRKSGIELAKPNRFVSPSHIDRLMWANIKASCETETGKTMTDREVTSYLSKRQKAEGTSAVKVVKSSEVSPKLWEVAKAICGATVGAGASDVDVTLSLPQARAAMAVYEANELTIVRGANLVRDTSPHINWHGCKKISKDLHAYFINGVYGNEN